MAKSVLPQLGALPRSEVIATLTRGRLRRYLSASRQDEHQALRLYVLNAKVSASLLTDLHYLEVALRNKFDAELVRKYGLTWFDNPEFLKLLKSDSAIAKAKKSAAKGLPKGAIVAPGKVIAELTFGFWVALVDRHLVVPLWTPTLHKAFGPGKPPNRADVGRDLETVRVLRNRIAHHEPIFHLRLHETRRVMVQLTRLLCSATARVQGATSTVTRDMMALSKYQARRER